MDEVAAEFIKPNDRLSSLDRLRIYNRMYWFRLIDCVDDDCPGLHALLGDRRFFLLVDAYLARYPSRSFALRNLCARLPAFLREEPRWTKPRTALALEVASFEWAQTVAFDAEARPVIEAADIVRVGPSRLRLGLQPYLTLFALNYPIDNYVIAVKKRNALRAEASNAVEETRRTASRRKHVPVPKRGRTYVAVYRLQGRLYYKRLELPAFRILEALAAGKPLAKALAAGGRGISPKKAQEWFALWTKLGWLCRRGRTLTKGDHEKNK
jgi:hypothetical protein